MKKLLCLCIASAWLTALLPAQQTSAARSAALEEAAKLTPQVRQMAMQLWNYSETALREEKSASYLARILQEEGFKVESNVAGMPTAFIASYGSGHPVIGVLAEFDALPGVGNAPVPRRQVRQDGVTSGQGCGHNLFGSASVAGAIALKRVLESLRLPGTLRLYGTPAEETVVGKVYMARSGVFDDLDACIEWHPSQET
ncbi:MAG: M20/M25/M40 family metallo-hydrolase, partial [Acidobacteriota bacterium]